jgi:hypothetical protein
VNSSKPSSSLSSSSRLEAIFGSDESQKEIKEKKERMLERMNEA